MITALGDIFASVLAEDATYTPADSPAGVAVRVLCRRPDTAMTAGGS